MDELKHIYTIDFTDVKQYLQMHQVIQAALDFPKYYGCNWDAFWDCLTDMVGRPIHIQIIGLEIIEQKFGSAAEKMMPIMILNSIPQTTKCRTLSVLHLKVIAQMIRNLPDIQESAKLTAKKFSCWITLQLLKNGIITDIPLRMRNGKV